MKRMLKLLLIICISIPLVVDARLNYDDSVQYANNYIYNFKEYQDYIHLKNNTPYDYVNNKSEVSPNFQSGGFLSRKEYEISNIKGNSYLSNGLQYWTLTKSSYQKHYIVDYKLLEQFDTNLSGVRITEYVKPDVSVVGTGSYGNPWSFEDLLSIHINSDNVQRGKVSSQECSNVSMRKESIHLSIAGSRSKAFYVCPEDGYKFLKSTCSKYITNHSSNNMYTVDNLDRDNVICKVSYSYITKGITVKACSSCETAKTDKTIYVNNTHKIFLKDIDGTTKIEKIDNLPTKTGYTFKGYFTSETDHIEENKIIDNLGNLKYNEQLNTKNKVYPYMKANEYTIKYDCNGGTGTIENSHHTYDVEANLTSNNCKRKGYKFEGWAVSKTGSKTYSNSQSVKNLTAIDNETVTLFAVWTQCPAGTYGSDGLTCTKCLAGTYNGTAGSTAASVCTACPAGKYSNAGAASCSNCAKGYYASGTGSTTCTICPVGTYASSTGSTSCTKCAAGKYNGSTGSTAASACKNCPAGKYSNEGAESCSNCAKGYYAPDEGSTTCTICPVGTYAASTGSTSCTKCTAGTYNSNKGSTESSACVECAAGTYSSEGANSCTNCSKGYYASVKGSTQCTICPVGTYASSTGSSSCTKCPSGTYNANTGSTASSVCLKCSKGYYSSAGSKECTICPAGTYSTNDGSASCASCPSGYTSNAGSTQESQCYINVSAGKYLATAKSATQTTCPKGTYRIAHTVYFGGTSSCDNCAAGTYRASTGGTSSSSCTACPSGYTSAAKSTAKSQCYVSVSAGKYIATVDSSTQTACPKGKYKAAHTVYAGNTSSCTNCPAGTYRASTGGTSSSSCTSCPSGYTSAAGSDSSSDCYANYTCSEGELTASGSSYICVKDAGWETWLGAIWSHSGTSTSDCRKNGGWSWYSATGYAGPGCYNNKEYGDYKCVDGWSDYDGSGSSLRCWKAASQG